MLQRPVLLCAQSAERTEAGIGKSPYYQTGYVTLVTAFLRHALTGEWDRPALYTGVAGTQQQQNYGDLHTREY